MKKQTYETDHPIIKEIAVGDKFIAESGILMKLICLISDVHFLFQYEYVSTKNTTTYYDRHLKHWCDENHNIKCRYISLKNKVKVL
jgi:hypothetical protein